MEPMEHPLDLPLHTQERAAVGSTHTPKIMQLYKVQCSAYLVPLNRCQQLF